MMLRPDRVPAAVAANLLLLLLLPLVELPELAGTPVGPLRWP